MYKDSNRFWALFSLLCVLLLGTGCQVRMADLDPEDGKTQIVVSDGKVTGGDALDFRTESPEMRGIFTFPSSRHVTTGVSLRFVPLGEPDEVSHLGNGEVRHQIGLKLLARDPCNLLYVMVRREQDGTAALYVSTKLNPGENTSALCTDHGYVSLAGHIPLGPLNEGVEHTLAADWDAYSMSMRVSYDGAPVGEIEIDDATLSLLGTESGVRTDNMVAEFSAIDF